MLIRTVLSTSLGAMPAETAQIAIERKGEPWFEDGNIILVTDESNSAFKVHRGVLARHSEIFRSMFEFPQPVSSELEILEGCQIVRMHDLPSELSNLIKALYDGPAFQITMDGFLYAAGILRLATKYFIGHLRTQVIRHLTQTWTYTLQSHDVMVQKALDAPLINDTSYPYVHPLHVLNLARETNVQIIVPCALYFLSIYPLEDIIRGDHPKLTFEHPSRPSSRLSESDTQLYTFMFQHRLRLILDYIRTFCHERPSRKNCENNKDQCMRAFRRLASRLSWSWTVKTAPLHLMWQAVQHVNNDSTICGMCRNEFQDDVSMLRAEIWSKLPSIVGLSTWDDLEAEDLRPQ